MVCELKTLSVMGLGGYDKLPEGEGGGYEVEGGKVWGIRYAVNNNL